ncbi:putative gag protein [Lampyris noctiluca errantivirus 1]|nr:putative gag protein [Lampyris noctiluca errantivirus 1]
MPVPELKEFHVRLIPEFNGNPKLLANFIDVCDKLINTFYDAANPQNFQNEFLILSIRNKITGHAAEQLAGIIIKTWVDVKHALINSYEDKRDDLTLLIEISSLKQGNRTYLEFYNHLSNLINLYCAYIQNHYQNPITEETLKININRLGLRVFTLGLKDPIGPLIRSRNPDSLNSAYHLLTNEFNVEYNKTIPKNNFVNATKYQNFSPMHNKPFPSQPIKINQNYNNQTPQQFAPRQRVQNARFIKPTPMSINTRFTKPFTNQFPRNPNFNNQRNFESEEIYNNDIATTSSNIEAQTNENSDDSFLDQSSLDFLENS